MQTYFQKMYRYEAWANMEVFRKIGNLERSLVSKKLKAVFSHLLIAQKIWLSRLSQSKIEFSVWEDIAIEKWKKIIKTY